MSRDQNYLYIDGGSLRSAMKKICRSLFQKEDAYFPLIKGMASQFDKAFYYDAVPGRERDESHGDYDQRVEPYRARFDEIQALDKVHVALGKIVGKDRRQKGVDVRLTVDMMTHAFRGIVGRATLFAGDADFIPLVKALVSEGLHVTVWHPDQANADLRAAADSTRLFSFQESHDIFTSNGIGPAFRRGWSSTHGVNPAEGAVRVNVNGTEMAGRWDGKVLTVRLSTDGRNWESKQIIAPEQPLEWAVAAFEHLEPEYFLSSFREPLLEVLAREQPIGS